jgi:predicted nucleic-acid-binding protein
MERSTSAGRPLFIPLVVLCELVWDLSRSHRQAKAEIVRLLEYLLEAKLFQVDPESLVRRDVPRDGSGVSRLHQFEVA